MKETEVNNLKNMCKTDPHLKGFVTEVTDEKQGASNQFQVTIATKKGARGFDSWSEVQPGRLGLAKVVLLAAYSGTDCRDWSECCGRAGRRFRKAGTAQGLSKEAGGCGAGQPRSVSAVRIS